MDKELQVVPQQLPQQAQPNDYIDLEDYEDRHKLSSGEEVWSILWYERELRGDEITNYELIRLEGRDK